MSFSAALIIDDDPLYHIVAEETLVSLGFSSVAVAEDGATGIRRLREDPDQFDLVLCDLNMPEMDGVSVIRELGQIDYRGALIIVSGEDMGLISTVRTMAQLVGVRVLGALKKPLDKDTLATLLRNPATISEQRAERVTRHMLKQAISEGRIQPVYQPKLDNRSRSITGVEVLLRVIGEHGELQSPEPFIIAAERDRMIDQLTDVIFRRALSDATEWKQDGFEPRLAFNLSPVSLNDLDLPDRLKSHFSEAGLEPNATTLEITENRLLDHHADVLDILSRLRLAGFRLSMDDFGTGATSMEQLRLFPFNELKIDKSFVLTALEDEFARTTVETGARLAAMLGLDIVAEGVETKEMLNFVIRSGASHAQGFYIARPLAAKDVTEWVRSSAHRMPDIAA